jgi:hypothetical protein
VSFTSGHCGLARNIINQLQQQDSAYLQSYLRASLLVVHLSQKKNFNFEVTLPLQDQQVLESLNHSEIAY